LAGLIFASNPQGLEQTPLVAQIGVPRVALMSAMGDAQLPAIWFDYKSFLDRALDYLKARGRRRIAVLMFPRGWQELEDYAERGLVDRGMKMEPCWILHFNVNDADAAVDTTRLLMHKHGPDSPDGLIIMDDNLADHALRGLVAAGVRVPEEVDVVIHANYPCTGPAVLPVKRLGFDLDETLRLCVSDLVRQRQSESVAPFTAMPARFEEELPLSSSCFR
jgi:DNA-binding LacI/PurR family transcriptional regulator